MLKAIFTESAQAVLHYQENNGEGPLLILIHGLGCTGLLDYSQVAQTLALKDRHLWLIDLLGAGQSEKPRDFPYTVDAHAQVLTELIQQRSSGPVVVYGHSLGGPIALSVAEKNPESVIGILLSEANLDPSSQDQPSYKTAQLSEAEFCEWGYQRILDAAAKAGMTWAISLATWLPQAMHRLSADAVLGGKPSWRQRLYALKCPKRFLFGEKSLPDPDTEELSRQRIEVQILHEVGHNMAYEDPDQLAQALADFITKIQRPQ